MTETETQAAAGGSRGDRAYETLRGLIVRGALAPGAGVTENGLARRLGMSRTPVRAALHRLQQEGFVVSDGDRRNRTCVAPLTREDAYELFDVLGALEGIAAHSAAALEAGVRGEVVARMRELNDELRSFAAAPRPDPNRRFENDAAFHACYVRAGAGPRVAALHESVKPQAERYGRLYVSLLVAEIAPSLEEHEAIITALAEGNPEAARRAAHANWRSAAERLDGVMEAAGELGTW